MPTTVKEKIERKIARSGDKVFVRKEFNRLGGYRQVSRALAQVETDGALMRVGQGMWVKSEFRASQSISNYGKLVQIPLVGLEAAGIIGLRKLGYSTDVRKAERDRLEGRTTQIPIGGVIRLKDKKTSRKIMMRGVKLKYETD